MSWNKKRIDFHMVMSYISGVRDSVPAVSVRQAAAMFKQRFDQEGEMDLDNICSVYYRMTELYREEVRTR